MGDEARTAVAGVVRLVHEGEDGINDELAYAMGKESPPHHADNVKSSGSGGGGGGRSEAFLVRVGGSTTSSSEEDEDENAPDLASTLEDLIAQSVRNGGPIDRSALSRSMKRDARKKEKPQIVEY